MARMKGEKVTFLAKNSRLMEFINNPKHWSKKFFRNHPR
jgi:hypothetical protein